MRFLGYVLDADGVSVDQDKLKIIANLDLEDLMDSDNCMPSQQKAAYSRIAKPVYSPTAGQKRKIKGQKGGKAGTYCRLTPQDWTPTCEKVLRNSRLHF